MDRDADVNKKMNMLRVSLVSAGAVGECAEDAYLLDAFLLVMQDVFLC
jgi:hypothetical protein